MTAALVLLALLPQAGPEAAPASPGCEAQPLARSFALNQIPVPGSVRLFYLRNQSGAAVPVRGFQVSGATITLNPEVRQPRAGHFCVEYRGVAPVACSAAKGNATSASHWSAEGRNCVSVWDRRRGGRAACCVAADGSVEIRGAGASAGPR